MAPKRFTILGIDHLAIAVENLEWWEALWQMIGLEPIYRASKIGTSRSNMDTVALRRDDLRIALVKGNDGEVPSQVSAYAGTHGDGMVQHIAIRVDDLDAAYEELAENGMHFSGPIKESSDGFGPLRQVFTQPAYPGGPFIEWIQRKVEGEGESLGFSDETVRGLYEDVEAEQLAGAMNVMFPILFASYLKKQLE